MKKAGIISILLILCAGLSSLLARRQHTCRSEAVTGVSKVMKSSGPPSCYAGEPPNNATCMTAGCHEDATLNSGPAVITLDLGNFSNGYVPGDSCTVNISVSRPGLVRAGFQIVALKDNNINVSPGTIVLTNEERMQVIDKVNLHPGACSTGDKAWVEHTYKGNTGSNTGANSWSFRWKAPAADEGNVTFYLAVLAANNDLTESGDEVYTLQKKLHALPAGIGKAVMKNTFFSVYPNPAVSELHVSLNTNEKPESILLYHLSGRLAAEWSGEHIVPGLDGVSLPVGELRTGIYYLQVRTKTQANIQKVIIGLP